MNQIIVQPLKILAVVPGMVLAIAPITLAQPGWQDWQRVAPSETLPFTAGFSNIELGGYLDFESACEQAAETADAPLTYWYRLSNLVWEIGTGPVEQGCRVGRDEFVATSYSTAVQSDLDVPVCLLVKSDIGNGVRIRAEPTLVSSQVGLLRNGTEIFQESLPAQIITDPSGRLWLSVQQGRLDGWASLADRVGGHVNFQMCSPAS